MLLWDSRWLCLNRAIDPLPQHNLGGNHLKAPAGLTPTESRSRKLRIREIAAPITGLSNPVDFVILRESQVGQPSPREMVAKE